MSKLAQYDSKAVQPTPIIGFYDTDSIDYPNLPASTELVQMSDYEWETRMSAPLFVLKGKIVPKPAPTKAELAAQFIANQAAALIAVDQFHAETVQQLAGNPTQVEKDTWAMKLATANAVVAKTPISGEGNAFMTAAGLTSSTLQSAWAVKVQANAAKFAGLVGLADNLRSQAKAAISAAVDQPALDAAIASSRAAAEAAIAALPKA